MYNNDIVIENFINFCDDMMIAEGNDDFLNRKRCIIIDFIKIMKRHDIISSTKTYRINSEWKSERASNLIRCYHDDKIFRNAISELSSKYNISTRYEHVGYDKYGYNIAYGRVNYKREKENVKIKKTYINNKSSSKTNQTKSKEFANKFIKLMSKYKIKPGPKTYKLDLYDDECDITYSYFDEDDWNQNEDERYQGSGGDYDNGLTIKDKANNEKFIKILHAICKELEKEYPTIGIEEYRGIGTIVFCE